MQKEIKQIFLDKNDNVYVTDHNDILYLYDEYKYYPFLASLNDIAECFYMGDRFFVHHSNTMSIFDENFNLVKLQNSWITDKIDKVCYCKENNSIATLEQGKVHVYFGVSHNSDQNNDDDVTMASISHAFKSDNGEKYIGYQMFQDIKIVNDVLLTFNERVVKIFHLKKNNFIYITSIILKKNFYDEITNFSLLQNIFTLSSGSQFYLNKQPSIDNIQCKNFSHFEIFKRQNIYFWIKDNNLCFYYSNNKINDILKPLISILCPKLEKFPSEKSDYCYNQIELSEINQNINIINGETMQIISINNDKYLINEKLIKIIFSDELICFDSVCELAKMDTNFIIDIENNSSILCQLINIIPNLYRLNNDIIFEFHQIDSNGNIISFGEGSTRHCFNYLRNEIDIVLQNNFDSYDEINVVKLGKLFYFCYVEGSAFFSNIHPYFFYLLSEKSDYVTLLKMFKGNDFNMYYNQYIEYCNDISKLADLDIGIKTIDEYMEYLFSGNLSKEQKLLYKSFVKGFLYFATRNKFYKFIKKLPLIYYIKMLTTFDYFNIDIEFSKSSDDINDQLFDTFCDIFNNVFLNLTKEKMSIFLQNVTGSQYYSGTVHVVLAYNYKEFMVKQLIYNENIDTDEEIILEEIMIDLAIAQQSDSNWSNPFSHLLNSTIKNHETFYEISTCNTELTINIFPSRENISEIINLLTIEDINMKN